MIDTVIAIYGGVGGVLFALFLYTLKICQSYHWKVDFNPSAVTETIKSSWDYCPDDPSLTYNADNFAKRQDNQWKCHIPKNKGGSVYLYTDYYIFGDRYFRFALRDVVNAKVQIITKFYGGTKDKWIESDYIPEMNYEVDTTRKVHYFDEFKSQILNEDVKKEQMGLHISCINENQDCHCVISEAYIGRKKNIINVFGRYQILFYKKNLK